MTYANSATFGGLLEKAGSTVGDCTATANDSSPVGKGSINEKVTCNSKGLKGS